MKQNIHCYSKRKEKKQTEETVDQIRTANQEGKLQIQHVWFQSTLQSSNSFQLCLLQHSSLSWTVSTPGLQLFWAGIPQHEHLQHHWVSNTIQALSSQLHAMASQDFHARTALTHTWPHWLSLAMEGDSQHLSYILDSKSQNHMIHAL